jgi:hypothetical protein
MEGRRTPAASGRRRGRSFRLSRCEHGWWDGRRCSSGLRDVPWGRASIRSTRRCHPVPRIYRRCRYCQHRSRSADRPSAPNPDHKPNTTPLRHRQAPRPEFVDEAARPGFSAATVHRLWRSVGDTVRLSTSNLAGTEFADACITADLIGGCHREVVECQPGPRPGISSSPASQWASIASSRITDFNSSYEYQWQR